MQHLLIEVSTQPSKCQPQTHTARVYHCRRVEFYSQCSACHSLIEIHYMRPTNPGGVKVVALMISINRSHLVHSIPSSAYERDGPGGCKWHSKKKAAIPPQLFLVALHGREDPESSPNIRCHVFICSLMASTFYENHLCDPI
ncbi:uncharacterized protein CEXT_717131 [Caerostris extrusa]|uniref:Uncharacterized protein n=1 Tax=Caerostris extrusa TaxID=172846 RepID=A0AAV4NZF0_CAEEX|nr:uncharacterized protein CEXT_717131 [Caerostris extrusa]